MRNIYLLLFLAVTLSGWSQQMSPMELLDIFDLEYISDPQVSPDGERIIYVRNFKDIMTDKNLSNLWMVNADGSQNRPLTTGNQRDFAPRWSHDGKKIVFRSNMKDDKTKLYLMWLDTREIHTLLNPPRSASGVSWSHDDKQLAFTMFVPKKSKSIITMPEKPEGANWADAPKYIDEMNYRGDGQGYLKGGNDQIFVISADGGAPRQLTDSEYDHGSPVWSKDGSKLYFSANLHEEHEEEPLNSEIYELALNDGSVKAITSRKGPDRSPTLSPDGKTLAFTGFDDRYQGYQLSQLYTMSAQGGEPRLLTADFDRDIEDIQWAANGKGLYFQYTDRGITKVGHITLDGKINTVVENLGGMSIGRPYSSGSFSVAEDGTLAYTLGGSEHPADLAVFNGKNTRRITRVNEDLFSYRKLGKVEELTWKSSFDQREVQGWLIYPPDYDPAKKYPLILEIHGGPFASYGPEFTAELQLFAASGYMVLYTNPRGSTSYGEEFGNLIHHDYPNHDYEDLISGVDAVIAKGNVDEEQLFVTGGSGGGVLTAWIVGKTDRFRAAVVAKPVINWYSFVLYADNPAYFSKYWFPSKPWEDPEHYMKRSPLSYVGNVTTPTMLLTGEEDYRTPIAESEQYYAALKLQGVESAMVRIPGASHGIAGKPSQLIAKVAAILAWFDKHKKE
ncbi:prolyl oligopeptidase family serine peptidase [Zeaxanthinibacter enoshimensis]|uniref:S9 family peptidase n=1 Tax=Zeaxanthinibacter enoshimensis TaxID=392009 RepID=UPI003567E3FF